MGDSNIQATGMYVFKPTIQFSQFALDYDDKNCLPESELSIWNLNPAVENQDGGKFATKVTENEIVRKAMAAKLGLDETASWSDIKNYIQAKNKALQEELAYLEQNAIVAKKFNAEELTLNNIENMIAAINAVQAQIDKNK